jgi:hypothetical protein
MAGTATGCIKGEAYTSLFAYPQPSVPNVGQPLAAMPWVWWDFDGAKEGEWSPRILDKPWQAARLMLRFFIAKGMRCSDALVFFSGSRGVHLGVRSEVFGRDPRRFTPLFEWRALCRRIAATVGVSPDLSIYDRARLFRAANSLHPHSFRYKVAVDLEGEEPDSKIGHEPIYLAPETFDEGGLRCPELASIAEEAIATAKREERDAISRGRGLNTACGRGIGSREVRSFIAHGAPAGVRHAELFRFACAFRRAGMPFDLAAALLVGGAADGGMDSTEAQRVLVSAYKSLPAA